MKNPSTITIKKLARPFCEEAFHAYDEDGEYLWMQANTAHELIQHLRGRWAGLHILSEDGKTLHRHTGENPTGWTTLDDF